MHILIVTDIFGVMDWVTRLEEAITELNMTVKILTPYKKQQVIFTASSKMYSIFRGVGGHDAYGKRVLETLKHEKADIILGFSAGGAAAWTTVAENTTLFNGHLICFYPTRLQKHLARCPKCPTTLIVPDVCERDGIDDHLENLPEPYNIHSVKTPFGHGFMNPQSPFYDKVAEAIVSSELGVLHNIYDLDQFRRKIAVGLAKHLKAA